jgi:hypothetical protein
MKLKKDETRIRDDYFILHLTLQLLSDLVAQVLPAERVQRAVNAIHLHHHQRLSEPRIG